MNALDRAHDAELTAAVEQYQQDSTLRAAVLTGAGERAFCAGADLRDMLPAFRTAVRAGKHPAWEFGGITGRPADGKPIIAAVNGHALAGGLGAELVDAAVSLARSIAARGPSASGLPGRRSCAGWRWAWTPDSRSNGKRSSP